MHEADEKKGKRNYVWIRRPAYVDRAGREWVVVVDWQEREMYGIGLRSFGFSPIAGGRPMRCTKVSGTAGGRL